VFEPGLDVDAIGPDVDVSLGGQVAITPADVLVDPGLLQPRNGRSREPAGVLAEQRAERFLEVTGGDALQVEDRDQHFEALRAPRVGRQNGRAEPNPLTTDGLPVAHARLAHRHRSDAGHDLALGQMTVTHDALVARLSLEIGISSEEVSDFRLHSLREKGTRPVAQNLGEQIGEGPWLTQLDDVSVGHGVSLLRWRSGGVEHPHDTPPYPFMPSPTSAHSSLEPSTDGAYVVAELCKYSCILASAAIDVCLEDCLLEYCERSSDLRIQAFIKDRLGRARNPTIGTICNVL